MDKDIPLKIETFSSGTGDEHSITSAKEIEFILHNIAEKGARVALYYGDMNDFILTTLLGADSKGIWLEPSQSSATNQKIAEDNTLTFVSSQHKIKIQFSAGRPNMVVYHDHPAFFLPLPDSLLRLQRREYFRLMTPTDDPLKCVIPNAHHPHKPLREVTIMDISSGGAALTCAENDTELTPGESYSDCHIDIPEFGTITGTIVVKNLAVLTSSAGHSYKRAGCELQDMDNPSIVLLQRYVMHLQRGK